MDPRLLTRREQEVLEALLSVDFPGVDNFRRQANEVLVVGKCSCGCPSVDFQRGRGRGMTIRVNAELPDSYDALFPAAAAWLGEVFAWLAGIGVDYFKIDFIYAGALEGGRHQDAEALAA